jgi:hypothetical protein
MLFLIFLNFNFMVCVVKGYLPDNEGERNEHKMFIIDVDSATCLLYELVNIR